MLDSKTVMVTGGTGSFGRKFAEIVLEEHDPRKLIVFSRDEMKQRDMRQAGFEGSPMRYFVGDVRDRERLNRAMEQVDIVVHAAALKQVPTCEYNPLEAVKTNIGGARNVINAALDNRVERVMMLSTDKAVNPVNLYGATKLVAEKLFVQGNSYRGDKPTRFSCVRYGNVVGSRGSVIPLFMKQREEGRLTITHEEMTRFWITLEQGVRFVLDCIGAMEGGEVFVPKIPSMRIVDLAEAIAPAADKEVIGIRPGEKLHEVLLTNEEARHAKELDGRFVVEPEHPFWGDGHYPKGDELPEGFRYTSGDNDEWLTEKELRAMVEELGYDI